jgi:hypothetical protein
VRLRFARQRFFPCRSRIDRKKLNPLISEGGDDLRIEGVPGTPTDHRYCIFGATEHPLEGGVSSYMNDPHCPRYLVAHRKAWLTLAVPTLGDVSEQRCYG